MRLLDDVDAPTRAIVAKKLARYAAAPLAVMRRLAHDAFEVAEPVLKHAECLTGADLIAIIRQHDARYAAAIASRRAAANADAKPAAPVPPVPVPLVPVPVTAVPVTAVPVLSVPVAAAAEAKPDPTPTPTSAPAQPETGTRIGEEFLKAGSA